jgi:transcriptional regulator
MKKEKFKAHPTLDELHRFIQQFNFATLVTQKDGDFTITHIPVMLNAQEGPYGTLIGHMAIQNPQVEMLTGNQNFLVIFQGPHAYISPTWYQQTSNVPTWNYTTVHAKGFPIKVDERKLSNDLSQLVKIHEEAVHNGSEYIIPDDYKNKLMQHIVGFKMEILSINGRFKLGQNRSQQDWDGIIEGLRKQNTIESLSLANYMTE